MNTEIQLYLSLRLEHIYGYCINYYYPNRDISDKRYKQQKSRLSRKLGYSKDWIDIILESEEYEWHTFSKATVLYSENNIDQQQSLYLTFGGQ